MTTLDSSQWMYNPSTSFYPHSIDQSLRFEDGDSAYLTRTFGSASNQRTWTWSAWIKRGNLGGSVVRLFNANDGGSPYRQTSLRFDSDQLRFYNDAPSGVTTDVKSSAVFRDVSAWYNIVLAIDTTSGTSSNRVKIYVNGSQITNLATSTYPTQNLDMYVNAARSHQIGASVSPSQHFDGYMAEVNFIDGLQLDPSSFGETKAGIWIPKDTSGLTFGTNGFRLKFQDSSALGDDTSGNGNDFSSSGLAATDVVLDSPTNNFVTLNPTYAFRSGSANYFAPTLLEGNLKADYSSSSGAVFAASTLFVDSGKWYAEVRSFAGFGWVGISHFTNSTTSSGYAILLENGSKNYNGTSVSAVDTVSDGDIIGIALDLDSGTIEFFINNSSQTQRDISSFTGSGKFFGFGVYLSGTDNLVQYNFGQDSSFSGAETAQGNTDGNGKGDFYYSPPSGFLALCAANLPNPSIDPAEDEEPADYFDTILYTGDGNTNQTIGSTSPYILQFNPDFVWIKSRSNGSGHHSLGNRVIGDFFLNSNQTVDEYSFSAFNFNTNNTIDVPVSGNNYSMNTSSETYVAWNWLAGGSASSNDDGSVTSSVSVNTEAGFSIVNFQGTGSVITVGHGLGSVPDFIILKSRDINSSQWGTYHSSLGATKSTYLNSTNAAATNSVFFNNTEPTDSVFTIGNWSDMNTSSKDTIAYCFHSVEGYSKMGSYTGNGSSDGPFVYTGFRVAWLLNKSATNTSQWALLDAARDVGNPATQQLFANLSNAEGTSSGGYDFMSNGFKIRDNGFNNTSGQTYIYLAFAEQPFKYSNAR